MCSDNPSTTTQDNKDDDVWSCFLRDPSPIDEKENLGAAAAVEASSSTSKCLSLRALSKSCPEFYAFKRRDSTTEFVIDPILTGGQSLGFTANHGSSAHDTQLLGFQASYIQQDCLPPNTKPLWQGFTKSASDLSFSLLQPNHRSHPLSPVPRILDRLELDMPSFSTLPSMVLASATTSTTTTKTIVPSKLTKVQRRKKNHCDHQTGLDINTALASMISLNDTVHYALTKPSPLVASESDGYSPSPFHNPSSPLPSSSSSSGSSMSTETLHNDHATLAVMQVVYQTKAYHPLGSYDARDSMRCYLDLPVQSPTEALTMSFSGPSLDLKSDDDDDNRHGDDRCDGDDVEDDGDDENSSTTGSCTTASIGASKKRSWSEDEDEDDDAMNNGRYQTDSSDSDYKGNDDNDGKNDDHETDDEDGYGYDPDQRNQGRGHRRRSAHEIKRTRSNSGYTHPFQGEEARRSTSKDKGKEVCRLNGSDTATLGSSWISVVSICSSSSSISGDYPSSRTRSRGRSVASSPSVYPVSTRETTPDPIPERNATKRTIVAAIKRTTTKKALTDAIRYSPCRPLPSTIIRGTNGPGRPPASASNPATRSRNKDYLNYKKTIHISEGKVRYECNACPSGHFQFKLDRQLKRHAIKHLYEKVKRFRCLDCPDGNDFNRIDALRRHFESAKYQACFDRGLYAFYNHVTAEYEIRRIGEQWVRYGSKRRS
ncbi:hypothetical protein BGZ83_000220 [Gryganskiella cystojenkinii]|nr:hypothetical protein BGZ83_000220 [Gryganskiella cystojenkinii]